MTVEEAGRHLEINYLLLEIENLNQIDQRGKGVSQKSNSSAWIHPVWNILEI